MDIKRIAHAAVTRWREKQKVQKGKEADQVSAEPIAEAEKSSATDASVPKQTAPESFVNPVSHAENVESQEEARSTESVPSSSFRHGRRRRATLPQLVNAEGRLKLFSLITNKSEPLKEDSEKPPDGVA